MSREIYTNPSNGKLYYLIHSPEWSSWEGVTNVNRWTDAALYSGGNLLTINDVNEYNWLLGVFSLPYIDAWIGLTDKDVEGNFEWMSGDPVNPDLFDTSLNSIDLFLRNQESLDYVFLVSHLTEAPIYWDISNGDIALNERPIQSAIVEMEPGIFIETKYVGGTQFYYHLYLVYRDSNGDERVIRGDKYTDSGTIAVEIDALLRDTFDRRKDPDTQDPLAPVDRFSREIDIGNRNADDVWHVMKQHAQNIAFADVDYNAYFGAQNSNSVIASVLHSVGININNNLPVGFPSTATLPGAENLLNIRTRLKGRNGARDIIYGGKGGGILRGQDGRDILVGEDGNNRIYGGDGNDLITTGGNGKNYISGGRGIDRIVLTEDADARDAIYIRPNERLDSIRNFSIGEDKLILMGGLKIEDLEFKERGKYTLITAGGEKLVALYGISSDEANRLWL